MASYYQIGQHRFIQRKIVEEHSRWEHEGHCKAIIRLEHSRKHKVNVAES